MIKFRKAPAREFNWQRSCGRFIFKARSPTQTMNALDEYLRSVGDEPVRWLVREVRSWGNEFSYNELAAAIEAGNLDDLIDWQGRYAEIVNERLAPLWAAAIAEASKKATRGMTVLSDSNDYVRGWINTHGGELITRLSDESRLAVMNVILRGQGLRMAPRDVAKEVRPLIGLNDRQAAANQKYKQEILQRYLERGMSESKAAERAEKAALKYAAKQHRYRAESIVLTENAFAYNRGAHMGVSQSIADGYMGRCAMIWTTAGTNRVCSRCLALKDTVVGYTDESGVTIPPLHPRCRCAIMYDEVGMPRATRPKPINPLLPAAAATEIVSPTTPEPQPEPTSRNSFDDFNFDPQRFGTYEDQVNSHGGSGNIRPDRIVEGHDSNPRRAEPYNIIDHKNYTGKVDKRAFYDEDGKIYLEVHATNHNLPKTHPFGNRGEHAHDLTWSDGKANRPNEGRELTTQERKDNGDIL